MLFRSIEAAGFKPGEDIALGMDVAASEFYDPETKKYTLKADKGTFTAEEMVNDYYAKLIEEFPILTIEDGLDENDWEGWKYMQDTIGDKIQLVGDDLYVTTPARIEKGIELGCSNSVLIKINQIGTITETLEAIEMAKRAGWTAVVSHRSGETEDTSIADLVVGMQTGQIKTGSASRTDRIAKYNQLIRIEDELNMHGEAQVSKFLGKKSIYCLKD